MNGLIPIWGVSLLGSDLDLQALKMMDHVVETSGTSVPKVATFVRVSGSIEFVG